MTNREQFNLFFFSFFGRNYTSELFHARQPISFGQPFIIANKSASHTTGILLERKIIKHLIIVCMTLLSLLHVFLLVFLIFSLSSSVHASCVLIMRVLFFKNLRINVVLHHWQYFNF